MEIVGGHDQLPPGMPLRVASEQVEQRRRILGDRLVGGEEAQIGVGRRRRRVVVASAQMNVAAEPLPLVPHHHRHLAVGLQVEESEHDVHAGAFHLPRPVHVVGLIEAGLEFHQRRHLLARLRCRDQRPRNRRVAAGAVERLLDGEHAGIVGGTRHEFHDRVERFVGMMQQDVPRRDGGEDVATPPLETTGQPWNEGLVVELLEAGQLVEIPEGRQVERAVDPVDLAVAVAGAIVQVLSVDDHVGQRFVGLRGDLDPHRLAPLAGLEAVLDQSQHVVRLLLQQFQVAVPRDAERRPGADLKSAEQLRQTCGHHIFEQHKARASRGGRGHHDDPRQDLRHLHHGKQTIWAQPLHVFEHHAQIETTIVITGRRVGRIDRHRREDRQDAVLKKPVDVFALLSFERVVSQELKTFGRHRRPDAVLEAAILPGDEILRALGHRLELLDRAETVGRIILRGTLAEGLLADARQPDHEEFVEVGTEDRQKFEPLHQRVLGVLRLLQHAEVELQPAQLAVEKRLRTDFPVRFPVR